jgi:hypothetical protein
MVCFKPRPLYPGERVPGIHRVGGWMGPRAGPDNRILKHNNCKTFFASKSSERKMPCEILSGFEPKELLVSRSWHRNFQKCFGIIFMIMSWLQDCWFTFSSWWAAFTRNWRNGHNIMNVCIRRQPSSFFLTNHRGSYYHFDVGFTVEEMTQH